MKVKYKPEGGRFGYGYDYYCAECGDYLGNSDTDEKLVHRATQTTGFLKKKTVIVSCINAGKEAEIRFPEMEAKEFL